MCAIVIKIYLEGAPAIHPILCLLAGERIRRVRSAKTRSARVARRDHNVRMRSSALTLCDVTQSYAVRGGGVKTFLSEKRSFLLEHTDVRHVLKTG